MQMTFETSSSVTLLFGFWDVHSAAGMVLSVLVVLLLTVFYEVLKVWRVWLGNGSGPGPVPPEPVDSSPSSCSESCASEASLTHAEPPTQTGGSRNRFVCC
uniref:Copper transport protein n=1 Tax=Kryptolebias marmoratus TaxID=37003 RepID=A0A3Q3AUU6_KRYMA